MSPPASRRGGGPAAVTRDRAVTISANGPQFAARASSSCSSFEFLEASLTFKLFTQAGSASVRVSVRGFLAVNCHHGPAAGRPGRGPRCHGLLTLPSSSDSDSESVAHYHRIQSERQVPTDPSFPLRLGRMQAPSPGRVCRPGAQAAAQPGPGPASGRRPDRGRRAEPSQRPGSPSRPGRGGHPGRACAQPTHLSAQIPTL